MNIMIVDDELDILNDYQQALKPTGYFITTCSSSIEALSKLKDKHYDVLIADYKMPELDGLELSLRVKVSLLRTKVILISGYGDYLDLIAPLKNVVHSIHYKPIDFTKLVWILRNIEAEEKQLSQPL